MDIETVVSNKRRTLQRATELRGSVIDVVRELLSTGHDEQVLSIVAKLLERNHELEVLVAKMRGSKNRKEQIAGAKLAAMLEALKSQPEDQNPEALRQANAELEKIVHANGGRTEQPKPPKQPPVRRPPPPGLRRVLNPIDVPEQERPCPNCLADRECIMHETTEVIDFIPAEVIVRLDVREILGCRVCDAELVRAPMGDKVVAGGVYGSRLVADLVVSKYWDGQPLNRKNEQLERLGLSMPSSSMSDQITWATELLRPIWQRLIVAVLGADVLHVDSTSLPVKDKDSAKGIVSGALWGYVGDQDYAVYLYTSTGKKLGQLEGEIGPEDFLEARKGYVVADASNLFDVTFKSPDRIEVGCNMHARRGFVKALDAGDLRASVPIAAFKALYDVEADCAGMTPEMRLRERQRRSKPVYDELLQWCQTYQSLEPPKSMLGAAVQYLVNQRVALTRFLDDGGLPIDNGIVERLHRSPAVGRRNFLFAGSHVAGERTAIAYSVLASCALADVNPVEYLADLLPRLARGTFTADEFPEMLPGAWKAARDRDCRRHVSELG